MRPARIFFGWKVVGAAFTVAVFAWGIGFYGPSVFLNELHATHGWPVGLISAAITTHYLLSAGLVVYLSDLHDRFGVARVTQAGAICLAAGAIAWAVAQQPWHLFAAALVLGAGWAATSGAAISAMVAPWFVQRRGYALSLAFNGASMGGVLFTPLWIGLIVWLGFTGAACVIGAATILLLLPLSARYFGPQPAELGVHPDGEPRAGQAEAGAERAAPTSRSDLVRQPRFVTLSGAFALGLFAQIGLIAHLVTLLSGPLGEGGAAVAISVTTGCAVVGRLVVGSFIGRVDRRRAAAGNFIMQACGSLLLLTAGDGAGLMAGCILFGLGIGNLVSLPPLIAQIEFGPADLGRVVALVTATNQAAFSFAPGVFGVLRDLAGSYMPTLALAGVLQIAAAGFVLVGAASGRR